MRLPVFVPPGWLGRGGARGTFRALLVSGLLLISGSGAEAQFGEYTSPGSAPSTAGTGRDEVERRMEEARWRFGGVRVAPTFGLRRGEVVDNVFAATENEEDVSDLTATLEAGATAYLPTGPDVFWVAEIRPQYVWWQDLEERRQLVGRGELGVLGFFERLTVEARAGRFEQERLVTPEEPQRVTARRDRLTASAELALTERFGLFASAGSVDFRDRSEAAPDPRVPDFSRLDRREEHYRAGLLWQLGRGLELGLGWERSEVDFDESGRNLSTTADAPLLVFRATGNRLAAELELTRHDIEPREGSLFSPTEEDGGRLLVRLDPSHRLDLAFYGRVRQLFALDALYSHFAHERFGTRVMLRLSERFSLTAFAETGEDDFEAILPATPRRVDDAFAWGVAVRLPLPRALPDGFRLDLGYEELELDSNLPGLDRTVGGPRAALAFSLGDSLLWE